ncbi:MAG: type IV pilus modification protein PilV [Pseudomonadota bacterium]
MLAASSRGLTLIEVLVTMVILSIGLLGIVSLHATSKTAQYEAIQRARAVSLADGLLEKVRANPAAMTSYVTGLSPVGSGSLSTPSVSCDSATCTPAQLAAWDMWAWERALDGSQVRVTQDAVTTNTAGFTSPRGCVVFTPFAGNTRTGQLSILLQWRGLHDESDGVAAGDSACGGASAGSDPYRRQVAVSTFVIDETEL